MHNATGLYRKRVGGGALLAVAALLTLSGQAHAQEGLDPAETAFADAIAAVFSSSFVEAEKETDGGGIALALELEDDAEVLLVRHSTRESALEAASEHSMFSSMADDPMLIEVRGRDMLIAMGAALSDEDLLDRLRKAAWKEHPWTDPTRSIQFLKLDLLEGGSVLRVDRPEGEAYERLKRLLRRAQEEARSAAADPDDADAEYEVISDIELRIKQDDGSTVHLKVGEKRGAFVFSPKEPSDALKAFAALVKLPLPTPATAPSGSVGLVGSLGQ